jgi:hypothetical protein
MMLSIMSGELGSRRRQGGWVLENCRRTGTMKGKGLGKRARREGPVRTGSDPQQIQRLLDHPDAKRLLTVGMDRQ